MVVSRSNAHWHRPRRNEDRSIALARTRRLLRRRVAAPRGDYDARSTQSSRSLERRSEPGPGAGSPWASAYRGDLAGDGPREECEFDVAERASDWPGPAAAARPIRSASRTMPTVSRCPKRPMERPPRSISFSASSSARVPAAARRDGQVLTGVNGLPASGDITRCRRRETTSVPGRSVTADGAAASKRFCPARAFRAITQPAPGDQWMRRRSPRAPWRATRRPGPLGALRRQDGARAGERDQPAGSACHRAWRRTFEYPAAVPRCRAWTGYVFSDRVTRDSSGHGTAIRAASAAPPGCGMLRPLRSVEASRYDDHWSRSGDRLTFNGTVSPRRTCTSVA